MCSDKLVVTSNTYPMEPLLRAVTRNTHFSKLSSLINTCLTANTTSNYLRKMELVAELHQAANYISFL